jgi:RNA polymerase sigma-70 factor (ECF subfamily)
VSTRSSRALLASAAEATVVALAMAGDDLAFEELVRRRQSGLRSLLRRLCGNAALADDLAQQAFLQAWSKLATLRAPGAFGGWLKQVAVNTWLAQARQAPQPLSAEALELETGVEDDPSLALDLDRLLARLKGAERVCVVLAYAEGLTHPEIAAATGWPLGTVKSHVLRGSNQLREWLTEGGQEAP